MEDKSVIINRIIADTESTSYLELGYGTGHNFKQIKCENKIGIDPDLRVSPGAAGTVSDGVVTIKMDSDSFFAENDEDISVVFIDGDHTASQVRKDISNALKCNPKAVILHDSLPPTESHQVVPRVQKQWTGDVWRSAVGFIESYPDVRVETYRSDYGLTCIYPEGKKTRKHFENTELSYEYFKKNAKELLNIID